MEAEDIKPLAVVTGGSSGIGYELAKQFLENGYDVLIAAKEPGKLGEAQQALEAMGLGSVEACEVDLSTPDGVEELYETATEMGPVDVLCCNAGHGEWGKFAEESDLDQELDLIQLNCTGLVHLTKLVLPDMLERDRGKILFTGSIAGTGPGPYQAVYHASKAFVNSFGQALRDELRETGVDVTVLMPGPTDTEFFERAGMEESKVAQGKLDDPAMVARKALEALQKGRDHVVTGAKANMMQATGGIATEPMKAAMNRKENQPKEGEA